MGDGLINLPSDKNNSRQNLKVGSARIKNGKTSESNATGKKRLNQLLQGKRSLTKPLKDV